MTGSITHVSTEDWDAIKANGLTGRDVSQNMNAPQWSTHIGRWLISFGVGDEWVWDDVAPDGEPVWFASRLWLEWMPGRGTVVRPSEATDVQSTGTRDEMVTLAAEWINELRATP